MHPVHWLLPFQEVAHICPDKETPWPLKLSILKRGLPLPPPLVSNVSARLEIQGQLLYTFSASLSFCYDICWPCKLVQNILWTNCKLSKYMFKGKQAKSSLSSNLCVKLISQKSKKVKLYQLLRHRQQTSKHSCGEGRSTQLRITSTLEGNTYFYSGEKYFMSEGKRSTDRYT